MGCLFLDYFRRCSERMAAKLRGSFSVAKPADGRTPDSRTDYVIKRHNFCERSYYRDEINGLAQLQLMLSVCSTSTGRKDYSSISKKKKET